MSMRFRLPALPLVLALTGIVASAQPQSDAKKLDLTIDASPLVQTASARLVSYADVVEPVQKTVVSVYSTKIVRQRLQMNPFFR